MDINYDLERRFVTVAIQVNALVSLLINKGIIKSDEYDEVQDNIKENEEIKEKLGMLDYGARIQQLLEDEVVTDEGIQWVKENGPQYDTEESVNKTVGLLELKKDPILGKLFNDKLWK